MKSPLAALEIRRGSDVRGTIVKRLKSGVALGAKKSHRREVYTGLGTREVAGDWARVMSKSKWW